MIFKYIVSISAMLLILFSCSQGKNKIQVLYFEEKNPVLQFAVSIPKGSVEIKGWANDHISINAEKKIIRGFSSDLKLINVTCNYSKNKIDLAGNIPDRVNGEINIHADVPFSLMRSIINAADANILFDGCLGDLEVNNTKGIVTVNFHGDMLRVTSESAIINLNLETFNTSDIVLKNKDGDINTKVISARENSFLDIKNVNGNVNLAIKKNIPHAFTLSNKNDITVKYPYQKIFDVKGEVNYITGAVAGGNFKIDISGSNGKINLAELTE